MSDSLGPRGLQLARLLCPSLSPWFCSNSCSLSRWCHPTISFSVAPFSSYPQSFLVSGSFPMSQLFASGGQSIGASASASVFPMNIQDWFTLGLTGLISLLSKGLLSYNIEQVPFAYYFLSSKQLCNEKNWIPERLSNWFKVTADQELGQCSVHHTLQLLLWIQRSSEPSLPSFQDSPEVPTSSQRSFIRLKSSGHHLSHSCMELMVKKYNASF